MLKPSLLLKRGCIRGLKNIVREEGWAGSVGSLFGVLLLGQVLLALLVSAHVGMQFLREQTDVRLEIVDTATDANIQDLIQNVRALPYVSDVAYITREQAYDRQRQRDPQLIAFLEKFGIENPFPETLGVRLTHIDHYGSFTQFLGQPVFAKVIDPTFLTQATDQQEQLAQLTELTAAGRMFLLLVMILFSVVLLFIIVELLRRRAILRREEIFVEQLVGAPAMLTMLPFAMEMASLLCVSLLLSVAFVAACVFGAPLVVPALGAGGALSTWSQAAMTTLLAWSPLLLLAEFALVIALSLIGTLFVLRPRLRGPMLAG